MTDWKNTEVVLEVPRELAQDIEKIAKKEDPKKTWNGKAREILYNYVALHKARGIVE